MKSLSEIRRDELEEYIFPGTDAAVFVFPKAVSLEELKALFADIPGQLRIYPGETQWKVKVPYWHFVEMLQSADDESAKALFQREEQGWDHEHCSFCEEGIGIGTLCHTAPHEEGGYYLICSGCSAKIDS